MSSLYELPFKINDPNQTFRNIEVFKADFYKTLHEYSGLYCLLKLSGPQVGIISAVTTVAARLSVIAESILKGAINVLGAPFVPQCSLCNGLSMLTCVVTYHLCILPFSILAAIVGIVSKTLNMAFNTENYTRDKWFEHDKHAKNAYLAKGQAAAAKIEREQVEMDLKQAVDILKQNPHDPTALRITGLGLISGQCSIENAKDNIKEALERLELAAHHEDQQSIELLGAYYLNGIPTMSNGNQYIHKEAALQHNRKGAQNGSVNAMMRLSSQLIEDQQFLNVKEGMEWLERAAKKSDKPEIWYQYATKLSAGLHGIDRNLSVAVTWYVKAMTQGHRESVISLAAIGIAAPDTPNLPDGIKLYSPDAFEKYKYSLDDVNKRRSELFGTPYVPAASAPSSDA